jgi:hypothetical protein
MQPQLTLAPLLAAPTLVDRVRSLKVARQVGARPNHCYTNALRALPLVPNALYVEGYVVEDHPMLCFHEHGWLWTPHGVIDPTPAFVETGASSWTYFAAWTWAADSIRALLLAHEDRLVTPLCRYLPSHGRDAESWRDAMLALLRHRSALSVKHSGEVLVAPEHEAGHLAAMLGRRWVRGARHRAHGRSTG